MSARLCRVRWKGRASPALVRAPSRSASRRTVAASRASTGSTDSDLTESWASRSLRPIMSAISLMMSGTFVVSALMT